MVAGQLLSGSVPYIQNLFSSVPAGQYDGFFAAVSYAPAATPLRFVPITPCRVADTRNPDGPFGGPAIAGRTSRDFVIPSSGCGCRPRRKRIR